MATVDYASIVLYALLAFNFLRVVQKASKTAHRIGLSVGAVSMILALVWELADEGLVSLPASVIEVLFWVTVPAFVVGAVAGFAYLADEGLDPDS